VDAAVYCSIGSTSLLTLTERTVQVKLVTLADLRRSFDNDEAAMRHAGIDPALPDSAIYEEHEDGSVDLQFPSVATIQVVKS
jgi:hypothetical protein